MLISLLASVGLDHTDLLGDTVEEISEDKCGIFRKNTPLIIGSDCPQEHIKKFLNENYSADEDLVHYIGKF